MAGRGTWLGKENWKERISLQKVLTWGGAGRVTTPLPSAQIQFPDKLQFMLACGKLPRIHFNEAPGYEIGGRQLSLPTKTQRFV